MTSPTRQVFWDEEKIMDFLGYNCTLGEIRDENGAKPYSEEFHMV